ncbi:MAG TPA: Ig-like domain-containing protein [Anaerolineaceae bacterium]|nr:Ig-like domain-containing protein [Anaerolineaceae bacterium]
MVKKTFWTILFVLALVGAVILFTPKTVSAARYIPVLAYHFVDTAENLPAPEGEPYSGYYVTPEQFENHLDIIQAYGYTTITLAELTAYMDGQPVTLPTKPVVITFDDGQQGVYQYAYPALKARGMTATFYIITDYVEDLDADRCVSYNWDGQPSCQVIWDEVAAMAADGFEIGSHSSTHPYNLNSDFVSNPSETTQLELINSKAAIEAHIASYTVTTFAYPHGSGYDNAALKQALHDAGYTGAVSYGNEEEDNRVDPAIDDIFALRRLHVDTCHTNELDVDNPWCFLMMRLDPYFDLPSPVISDVVVTDLNGDPKTTFLPGEDVYVTVQIDNWDKPVNVKTQLKLDNGNGSIYDSHPAADQTASPLRIDITNEFPDYHWTIPDDPSVIGNYTYTVRVMDVPFVMQYHETISTTTLFQVASKTAAFNAGTSSITVIEDSGLFTAVGWAQNIDPGLPTYPSQTVTFDLSGFDPGLFSQAPQINANGDLSFITQANANGTTQVAVTLQVRDSANAVVRSTATQTLEIHIDPVNDVPSFTVDGNVEVNEDSGAQILSGWAKDINSGPANESTQTVSFTLSGYDAGLFSELPALSPSGTLSFTAMDNAYGSTTVSVVLQDDGGTVNGGKDISGEQIWTILIQPVNDAPSFAIGGSIVEVSEDSGTQTLAGWASNISAGPANESSQTVSFQLSGYDAGLFSGQPAISASGDLTFTPAADANGSTTLIVALKDDGGMDHGGTDTSATQTLDIQILPVNDAPSFSSEANVIVSEDSGSQVFAGWASAIKAGPPDESTQPLSFDIWVSQPGLFSMLPKVSTFTGDLSFTPAENANGTATFVIKLFDGDLYSNPQISTITITAVNDVPITNHDAYTMTASQDRLVVATAPGVLGNDADADGDSLSAVLVSQAVHGTLDFHADGSFKYTSQPGFVGVDQFTYRVWDGQAYSESTTVYITVPFIPIEIYLPLIIRL